MSTITLAHSFFKKSSKAKNPYIQFRQIFRYAQQHVQISRHISLVATYPDGTDYKSLYSY